jgi:hypothetical protein
MVDQNEQKQKLTTLIQGSMFLEEDLKIQLLQNLDKANEQDLKELETIFTASYEQQDSLIEKMLTYDPTFLPRLKDFKRTEIRGFQKQQETKERAEENPENILSQM